MDLASSERHPNPPWPVPTLFQRIEFVIVQSGYPNNLPAGFDHQLVQVPSSSAPYVMTAPPGQLAGIQTPGRPMQTSNRAVRQIVVLKVVGRLGDVVEELDRAIELALADGPRGVVCDLSNLLEDADASAVEMLATAGRHVRDWPGTRVTLACPDPHIREVLRAHPLGGYLIVTASLFSAVFAVLATPVLAVERLQLAAHPTAPRLARDFVTRTLLDWRLGRVIPFASLVVGELVANSSVQTGTDIDLSVVWNLGALRLTVRDHGPTSLPPQPSAADLRGRRRTIVGGLSRAFGVLPTGDGGKVRWAVLEAPQPRLSTKPVRSGRADPTRLSPVFTDWRGSAELPVWESN